MGLNAASSGYGLQTHIWNNNLKSIILLGIYPAVIIGMVWAISALVGVMTTPGVSWENADQLASGIVSAYWPIILAAVCIWFLVSYLFHTTMVRKMAHSHPVSRKDDPEYYNLVENLCISVGMKMPKLEIIESHARNAFASGINDSTYTVTVTRGLLQSLSKDEVEAVVAHELTHILNRDVRLLIVAIIFTGMIGFAAQMVWSQVRYGLWVGRRSDGKGNGMIVLMVILAVLWVGYFATIFTRFALSRRREYMADAGAVQMTKNPDAMMRALMRIAGKDQIPKLPGDIAMMCVENRALFMGLFSTHPPIAKRIVALSETTATPVPDLPQLRPFHAPRAPKDAVLEPAKPRDNWITRERFARRRQNPWKIDSRS